MLKRPRSRIILRDPSDIGTLIHEAAHGWQFALEISQPGFSRFWEDIHPILRYRGEGWKSPRLLDDFELVRQYAAFDYTRDPPVLSSFSQKASVRMKGHRVEGKTVFLPASYGKHEEEFALWTLWSQMRALPEKLIWAIDRISIEPNYGDSGAYLYLGERFETYDDLKRTCEHIAVDTEEVFLASRDPHYQYSERVYALLDREGKLVNRLNTLVEFGFLGAFDVASLYEMREQRSGAREAAE